MYLYSIVDEFEGLVKVGFAKNDISFVRANVVSVARCVPLKDVNVFCIGKIDSDTGAIMETEKRLVSWDIYSLPETEEDALKPLGDDAVKAYHNAKMAKSKKDGKNE